MTIIVFLIDTSASMNQRTYIGARPTLLDIAKGAVESFVKLRQRNPESRFDRYMLFTSEEAPSNIKAGWKENLATFMNELKNIRATSLTTLGPAIKSVFDVLNINRMQSGIDTYGAGRSPFFLEPSVIVCITDGGRLTCSGGVQDDIFPLPKSAPIPGADLTNEIFRWDQRLFGLVLRLTGTPTPDTMGLVPSDSSTLDDLCEQTGGRTYAVRTHRMFQQCIESLVQKVLSGVVINFEKIGPDPPPVVESKETCIEICEIDKENQHMNSEPHLSSIQGANGMLGAGAANPWNFSGNGTNFNGNLGGNFNGAGGTLNGSTANFGVNGASFSGNLGNLWHKCRKMIFVPRPNHRTNHANFWPIPESYWPDSTLMCLPARSAHPNLKFTCTSQEPMVIDNLPFDKYELEPSPLTQYILSRKQPTICWQVFIANSSKNSDVGHPFGYLKASTTKPCVNLFVMPYNYPLLLPLLDDLFKTHRLKPTKEWRLQFDAYLRTMPPYYASPLKRALERMGVSNVFPDKFDSALSYIVMNQLKKLKNQAKIEYEKICCEVEKRVQQNIANQQCGVAPGGSLTSFTVPHEGVKVKGRKNLKNLTSNHLLKEKLSNLRDQVTEYKSFTITVSPEPEIEPQLYRNPFDVPRVHLIDQVARMRANFLQTCLSSLLTDKCQDQLHSKPISQMGNYQDYLKKMNPPLREIESAPVRQHMFGNPFKIDKRMSMMVDEADVDLIGAGGGRGNKRQTMDPLFTPGGNRLNTNKRRKGPVPPEFTLQQLVNSRSNSPSNTPPQSPIFVTPPPSPFHSSDSSENKDLPLSPISAPQLYNATANLSPVIPLTTPLYGNISPILIVQQTPPLSSLSSQGPQIPLQTVDESSPNIIPRVPSQTSPPGSPSPPAYSRDDDVISSPAYLLNGDIDTSHNKIKKFSENEIEEIFGPSPPESEPQRVPSPLQERPIPEWRPNYAPEIIGGAIRASVDSNEEEENNNNVDTFQTAQFNKNLLSMCYKEVKKPGREFTKLIRQISSLQGSLHTRIITLKSVIHEALRFKRHSLVRILTNQLEELANGRDLGLSPENLPRSILVNGYER